jgi:hypothetical protein
MTGSMDRSSQVSLSMNIIIRCARSPVALALALTLAGTSAIAFGIVGLGRAEGFGNGQFDMRILYVAGRCLGQGLSAYDPVSLADCGHEWPDLPFEAYAYPPQMATLEIALSLLSFSWARVLVTAINFACIIGLIVLCAMPPKVETDLGVPGPAPEARWLISALILGNPFTTHVLWMGQTTLIAAATVAGGWVLIRREYVWLGGMLIGIATIKPQISILVVVWLLLERRWKALIIGAAFALMMSLPEVLASGPIGAFADWLSAIGRYQMNHLNFLGFIHLFGLQNFLATIGLSLPSLTAVGLLATMILWWFRRRIPDPDILPLLMGLSLLFNLSHDYDLAALVVLFPAFWRHLRGREFEAIVAAVVMLALFLPQRLFWSPSRPTVVLSVGVQDALLVQYRVLIVVGLVIWLLVLDFRQSSDLHSVGGRALRAR